MLTTKIRVVLGSIVTWLTIICAALPLALNELANYLDDENMVGAPLVLFLIRVGGAVLGVATLIVKMIQRVSPAVPAEYGLLPGSAASSAPPDRGLSLIETIVLVVVIVLAIYGVYVLLK